MRPTVVIAPLASAQATRTYSKSTGLPLMPTDGGATQPAIFPGSVTGCISECTYASSSGVGSHVGALACPLGLGQDLAVGAHVASREHADRLG